ncbi:MAG: hypothetical protein KDA66_15730 [Planctomycetaceae bacterium]|nr:hypothetical protein [Planctomycetaceae bacterium]
MAKKRDRGRLLYETPVRGRFSFFTGYFIAGFLVLVGVLVFAVSVPNLVWARDDLDFRSGIVGVISGPFFAGLGCLVAWIIYARQPIRVRFYEDGFQRLGSGKSNFVSYQDVETFRIVRNPPGAHDIFVRVMSLGLGGVRGAATAMRNTTYRDAAEAEAWATIKVYDQKPFSTPLFDDFDAVRQIARSC